VTAATAPPTTLLLTAEHGGNEVPPAYENLFRPHKTLLGTHRGWDPGSLPLARALARELGGVLIASTVTRLLVDLNRSETNPSVFSEVTRVLPREDRALLLERHHRPHRSAVEARVTTEVSHGRRVLHVGVHTFTPRLDATVRSQDVALLYATKRDVVNRALTQLDLEVV